MVVNVSSPEKLPEITEPLWMDLEADINVIPVMDALEFEKAKPGIERVAKARV